MFNEYEIKEIEKFKHIFQNHINLPLTIDKEHSSFSFLLDDLHNDFENFVLSVNKDGDYYHIICKPKRIEIRSFEHIYANNKYEFFSRTKNIENSMKLLLQTFKSLQETINSEKFDKKVKLFQNIREF